jgi:hypothetical protein
VSDFAEQHDDVTPTDPDPFADTPSDPVGGEESLLGGEPEAEAPGDPSEFGLEETDRLEDDPPFDPEDDAREDLEEEVTAIGDDLAGGEEPPPLPPGVEAGTLGGVNLTEPETGADIRPEPGEPGPGDEVEDDGATAEGADQSEAFDPSVSGVDYNKTQVPGSEDTPEPTPDTSPESAKSSEKPKSKSRRKSPKAEDHGPGKRSYTILKLREFEVEGDLVQAWEESFCVVARSNELALRAAYRKLSGNKEGEYTLVPVPTKYWNPEPVRGKVPDAALAIKVG